MGKEMRHIPPTEKILQYIRLGSSVRELIRKDKIIISISPYLIS